MVALIGKSRVWLGVHGSLKMGFSSGESSRSGIDARLCGWNLLGINARPTAFLTALKLRFQVA